MRLRVSMANAEERITAAINEGYEARASIIADFQSKRACGTAIPITQYRGLTDAWTNKVADALDSIFPSRLQSNALLHLPIMPSVIADNEPPEYTQTLMVIDRRVERLLGVLREELPRHTDLPQIARLFVQDIDSFRKVRDVNHSAVSDLVDENGYFDRSEDEIQHAFERIVGEAFHKKDWGGEQNDLYTTRVIVNGRRVPTAFMLKGNGLRKREMQLRDCGKSGNQIVRLFDSPAELYIVQFVGRVSEDVVKDVAGKVDLLRSQGKAACYCVIDGTDIACLFRAYGGA